MRTIKWRDKEVIFNEIEKYGEDNWYDRKKSKKKPKKSKPKRDQEEY